MVLGIMVSTQCNFHCGHCMVNSSYDFSWIGDSVLEKFYQMIEYGKVDDVYILGGEPFLHMEQVEKMVERIRQFCTRITVFTNGSFLLNEKLARRVKNLNIIVRISDDRFHREFWPKGFEEKLIESKYWVVDKGFDEDMMPVGRAYEEFKHLEYNMGCSLVTGRYDKDFYPNAERYMVMMDGSVNLYCATIEGALANVFEDEQITYGMLVKREKALHNYLFANVIKCEADTYMAKLCNQCSQYKVTDKYIFYKNEVVAKTADYLG